MTQQCPGYRLFFVWIEDAMGSPFKAAIAVALSQLALVNVDFVLSGKRGISTAAVSSALLLISWAATAWVYRRLKPKPGS